MGFLGAFNVDNRRNLFVERVAAVFICPLEELRVNGGGGHGLEDISPKFVIYVHNQGFY